MNLFQPSFHMLPPTWRWDDAHVQLVLGGEPLTPAANQTACRPDEEKEEGEEEERVLRGVMVMEEVDVSGGVIRLDSVPSYGAAGCDLKTPAVHSRSLLPHPASKPNTPFIMHPSSAPTPPNPLNSLFWIDGSQGKGEGSWRREGGGRSRQSKEGRRTCPAGRRSACQTQYERICGVLEGAGWVYGQKGGRNNRKTKQTDDTVS